MKTVNVHEAKTHLSSLLARVEGGEEIVIARAGKPVARLSAYVEAPQPRPIGLLEGRGIELPDEVLFGPDPEIERLFDGDEE